MSFKVTYNGNGNTQGQPPVDNNTYNAGDSVNVLEPYLPRDGQTAPPPNTIAGSLARVPGTFAYWNTAPDGSGTPYYWPFAGATFQISSNVTIYAAWFITDGLTNGGKSSNGTYAFAYDSALQKTAANPTGLEPDRTNQLIASSEADFKIMSDWFGGNISPTTPMSVSIANRVDGAAVGGPFIVLCMATDNVTSLRYVLVAEVVEILMQVQNQGWYGGGNEQSCGEGLSRFLAQQFLVTAGLGISMPGFEVSAQWLNSSIPSGQPGSTQVGGRLTALTNAIDNSVTSVTVDGSLAVPYAKSYIIQVDTEQMLVTAFDGNSKIGTVARGFNGTTAAAHNAGSAVLFNYGPRSDYVNVTLEYDHGPDAAPGCALLFLYYLNVQLGFSINAIIAAAPGASNAASCLRGVYRNLTGDNGDPFPFFRGLLDHVFPPGQLANIPGPNPDNPFPLGLASFWVDKSTFGPEDVLEATTNGGTWSKAFWLVVEGFSKNSFNSLGVTASVNNGPFANLPGITITTNPDIDYENAANAQAPQRIRIPCDITFNSQLFMASFPPSGSQTYELDAFLTIGGTKVPGSDASTEFELVAGADPFFTNINPSQNNVFYLSQDLRVFSTAPQQQSVPVAGGPTFPNAGNPSSTDGYSYIQILLAWLNANYSDPTGVDPFASAFPNQSKALTVDSSVSPGQFNFAIARVRLAGSGSSASNMRVFFRLFCTETADADYQTDSTYTSVLDATMLPASPLVGADHVTLPFCASGNFVGNSDYGPGGVNTRNIQVPAGGDGVWSYFGCFLNLYDPSNVIDGQPVQAWLTGTHHCIVAQIAYDGAPIPIGANPVNSDKLAQRNLQITLSDNPGGAATHRIPQTFDIRPSAGFSNAKSYPDELMIDWGDVPAGSMASIYWPQVSASDVIDLASWMYSSHTLTVADSNTIQCRVTGGVTYIPIPFGAGLNFAGLLTVDLPTTVVTGQEFEIVVRRISSRDIIPPAQINLAMSPSPRPDQGRAAKIGKHKAKLVPQPLNAQGPSNPAGVLAPVKNYRYVVGVFGVRIPVADANTMLGPEQDTLAILKWRLQQMAPQNRWYPVLERYISYISARVAGLGGDPTAIPPSLSGAPITPIRGKPFKSYTGKVCEVVYDCFGDFEGFAIESCCQRRAFKTCEKGIGELVLRACRERMVITVYVEPSPGTRIREVIFRCCGSSDCQDLA